MNYFKALNVGQNAKYTSPQIVADFLDVINGVVEEEVLSDMKGSSSYSVMADESTNVSYVISHLLHGAQLQGAMHEECPLKGVTREGEFWYPTTTSFLAYQPACSNYSFSCINTHTHSLPCICAQAVGTIW